MLTIEEAYELCNNNPNVILKDMPHTYEISTYNNMYYTGRFVARTDDLSQYQFKYDENSKNIQKYMWYYVDKLKRFTVVVNKIKLPINYKGEQCGTK